MIQEGSLSATVDAVNAAHFEERSVPAAERGRTARWIAARQGLPGAYADTFAGFAPERKGIAVFTGERITCASSRHILGEEACRALRLLGVRDAAVATALGRAEAGLLHRLAQAAEDPRNANPGRYCCGRCSVGLWRNLVAGGLDRQEERLRKGVGELRRYRDGEGRWRVFPFWYTVLALGEMDFAEAVRELQYVSPVLDRVVKRAPGRAAYARRRHELATRVLGRRGTRAG